jgi:deoxyuridine 5'-triphosphate nucleotidohydrolase
VGAVLAPEDIDYSVELQRANILKRQAEDGILKMVRMWVCQEHLPDKKELRGLHQDAQQYSQIFETLKIQEDGILAQEIDTALGHKIRILVPDSLKEDVFKISHQHRSAGHFGVSATTARIRRNFWYPGMNTDIRTRVATCLACLAKITKEKLTAGIHVPQRSGYPMQSIYCDLVGPLPVTPQGYQYILSVQDGYSRFISLYPLVSKEAKGVVDTLVDKFIKIFGCPGRLHSDNGTEFVNSLMTGMRKRLEICHTRGPPYNPQSNQVERFHKTLAAMLRVLLPRENSEWDKYLPSITLAYNTKVNQTTGVTPSLAFLGREAKLPVDLVIQTPDQEYETQDHGVRHMLSRYNKVYNYYSQKQEGAIRRNAKRYAGTAQYEVGDEVWYLSSRRVPGKPAKLTDHWVGPWIVVNKVADVLYRIRPKDTGSKHKEMTVNVSRMKKMIRKTEKNRIPSNITFDREEEDSDGEELYSGAPHTSTHIPVYTPTHYPVMRDVGVPPLRQPDRVEEGMIPPQQPQVVEDAVMPPPQEAPTVDAPISMDDAPTAGTSGEGTDERGSTEMDTGGKGVGIKRGREETPSFPTDYNKRRDIQEGEKGIWGKFRQNMREYEKVATEDTSLPSTDDEMSCISPLPLNTICIPIKRGARFPYRATKYAAGYDLYAPITVELPPGKITAIDLGLSLALPAHTYLQLSSRSGLAKKGIQVLAGVIDPDFRGSIKALFLNNSGKPFTFNKGQRCCQGLLIRYETAEFKAVDVLPSTQRGTGGFGHTN